MRKCVIFDYGGTLVYSVEHAVVNTIIRSLGFAVQEHDAESLVKRYYEVWYAKRFNLPRGRRLTAETIEQSMYEAALDVLGSTALAHKVASSYVIAERECATRRLYPDVLQTLKELRNAGVRIGIVSENLKLSGDLKLELAHLGIGQYCDCVVTSEELSLHKPDPEIFKAGAKALGAEPGDCLYVGDSFELDIEGALKAGMKAALIRRGEPRNLVALPPTLSSLTDVVELALSRLSTL